MKKFFLIFNTLKYLKWQQIYFRLVRKIIKPKVTQVLKKLHPNRPKNWVHHKLHNNKIDSQLQTCFLNHTKKLNLPTDWNNKSLSKLWTYNLHYFEDLLSENTQEKNEVHFQLLNQWVDENPVGYGNGWEPYTISLRIVNILKAWFGGLELNKKLFNSTFAQASYLSNTLEKHLLGNHYFVNLKALLFAGVVFKNTDWLSLAEKGLISEIPEQILKDGANFELSPMYHSLMLVDMLDMLNLSKAYPKKVPESLVRLLNIYIPKMLTFLEVMSHPDGGVSFFNDSVDGIAPSKSKIEEYAKKLGFKVKPINLIDFQVIDNTNSGYMCATGAGNKLIFDAAAVGPGYIPGHAHADTLSFELSIGAQRVFVNSGTSEYGLTLMRLNQRRTASHNTVEVDGKDSSQVWSGFRVGNRAEIISKHTKIKHENRIELLASHNGYKSLFGGCIHTRKLTFSENRLMVSDSLESSFKYAKSRFYFHPDLLITLENNLLRIEGAEFILHSDLTGKLASLIDSFWYPEFGVEKHNKMLELQFEQPHLDIAFTWSKN
jgi:uncharacterized heparinase superfamily protein